MGITQSVSTPKDLELLKNSIRQSTYYDSAAVFKKGQEAIKLSRKYGLPSEEGLIYQYYGNFYYFSYNIDNAKKAYHRSIEIAKRTGDVKLVNSTMIRLAFIESSTNIVEAEKMFRKLLIEAERGDFIENQVEIYNGLGNLYSERMIEDTAMNYYLKGLRIAEKNKKNYLHAMMLNNIGLLKFSNGQTTEASEDFKKAVTLLKGLNEERLLLNLNNNLGLVFKELKKYQETVKYYKNTLVYAKKLGFPLGISVAHLNLADSYEHTKEFLFAIKHADTAIITLGQLNEINYLGMAHMIKATILTDLKSYTDARKQLDTVLALKPFYSGPNNVIEYYRVLSDIDKQEGKFQSALKNSEKYYRMKDSLDQITNRDKLSELQVIYGKEQMESELENERNKNKLLNKENQLKRAKINAIVLIAILLLIVGLGGMFLRSVYLSRKQQVLFTQKLIESTDQERSRISRDLHDDIGQSLSVIKSKVNMFNTGKIDNLEGLEKEVGYVIEQTRNISHLLHPSAVAKLGLERSVSSLLEKTQANTDLVTSVSVKNDIELLQSDVKTQIYRIIQECINNTVKHANATALKVSLKIEDDQFQMTYRDNGFGFKQGDQQGLGMLTMRERAHSIGGKLNATGSDKGFKLTLEIPVI
jgi:signal transduction histidine kinase